MANQIEFVLHRKRPGAKVSIILLDWGVRESFHSLSYLNQQTVSRDRYDLIWIEFYNRKPKLLQKAVDTFGHQTPALDKWVVLGYDKDVYYHKHRMYNVGIFLADGEICVICDSDVIFSPTFVENIIQAFDENPNSVVHVDEVRNNSRRFYPFNFPSIEKFLEKDCTNWTGTTTTGLNGSKDILHDANYGACMAARKKDLIRIGGADEHVDYLGYICGPYELTFRLINSGCKERWLTYEFLYHTWHPGESGINIDYQGPSDGRGMAQRALDARKEGRILPYQENAMMRDLRLKENSTSVDLSKLFERKTDSVWKSITDRFRTDQEVRRVKRNYRGFHLYSYRGTFYGLSPREGAFDPEKVECGFYTRLYSAPTLEKLKKSLPWRDWRNRLPSALRIWAQKNLLKNRVPSRKRKSSPLLESSPTPRLVREGYRGFNVIRYREEWFAHPQGSGEFSVSQFNDHSTDQYLRAESKEKLLSIIRSQRPTLWCIKHLVHRHTVPRLVGILRVFKIKEKI